MKDNQDLWSSIILEVMILDTLNPVTGFSVNLLSLMTLRHLASEKPFWIWTSLQHSKGRVGRTCASLYPCSYLSGLRKKDCFSTLTFGHDILPMQWPWISCEGTSPSAPSFKYLKAVVMFFVTPLPKRCIKPKFVCPSGCPLKDAKKAQFYLERLFQKLS